MYKSHIRIDATTSLWLVVKVGQVQFLRVACNFKLQRGSCSFEYAVVESLSIVLICYHNNYSSDLVFPYFATEQEDASCQSWVTYLTTDSLRLGRSCKRALPKKVFWSFFKYCTNLNSIKILFRVILSRFPKNFTLNLSKTSLILFSQILAKISLIFSWSFFYFFQKIQKF